MTEGSNYYTIHRLAVDNTLKRRGFASTMIKYAEKICI